MLSQKCTQGASTAVSSLRPSCSFSPLPTTFAGFSLKSLSVTKPPTGLLTGSACGASARKRFSEPHSSISK
jgi:hypothetical protein